MAIAKVRELLTLLRKDGWQVHRQEGSHRQFRHPVKRGTVTVNGHEGDTLSHSLVRSILNQAGLTREDLRK
jgi:predicted RNA binding protein YcfA (HicA-like mRNA interferase family)